MLWGAAGGLLAGSGAIAHVARRIAKPYTGSPADFWQRASPEARALVEAAYADLGDRTLHDFHTHLVGLGTDQSGIYVNPKFSEGDGPIDRLKFYAYLQASGISDRTHADRQYVERLAELAQGFGRPVALHVLALDYHYDRANQISPENSEFYIPDAYAVDVAREFSDRFIPVASIHPRGPDPLAQLDAIAELGVRTLKWLPNAQKIDPLDPAHDAFYDRMVEHGIQLLSHTGIELAVAAREDQELGNPLRLRRPLERGVRVIAAHCASLGSSEDLDHGGRPTASFDLFLRMMDEPAFRGRLFGELSAVTLFNRKPSIVSHLLERTDLHSRMVNGSDYPLSAIPWVSWPLQLALYGHLRHDQVAPLDEIHSFNPLLFEFVLKRCVRGPNGEQFPKAIFTAENLPGTS